MDSPVVNYILAALSAILFYRIAAMERRSAPIWSAASVALSAFAIFILHIHVLVVQIALFCFMWFLNYLKPDRKIDI